MNNKERSFTGRETILGKTAKNIIRSFLETVWLTVSQQSVKEDLCVCMCVHV